MSNPTSNFGWQMPPPTDLVTDLPADFEVFGQAVDTSLADLKGGTSGQILSKNSNTDMDFIWIANDQGDITGVTATSPLTGGGTSGAITVGIQASSTTQSGAVQLEDSTSSTSTTKAATPNSVKTSYDLANAAIPKSLIDAAGDLIVGTANDTAGRLALGTANQLLRVNSGATAVEWATVSTTPTFSGCRLTKLSGNQSIADSTYVAVTWPTEVFDVGGYHDTSTNTSRITIPSGKAGYYRFSWRQGVTASACVVRLYVNGTGGTSAAILNAPNSEANGSTIILNLAVGDYVEVYLRQTSGTAKIAYDEANGAVGYIWFDCEYLGA